MHDKVKALGKRLAPGERMRRVGFDLLVTLTVLFVVGYIALPADFWPREVRTFELTGAMLIRASATALLAIFPAWLLLRFMTVRAPALWSEFTINLHRLGVDRFEFLPEPPEASEYHLRWENAGGRQFPGDQNLYRSKFEATYGHGSEPDEDPKMRDTGMPVLLYTVTVALGWTAIFARADLYLAGSMSLARVLAAAFAGAYLFNIHMLMRRYFQNDLKSSAYVTAFVRTVTVLLSSAILLEVFPSSTGDAVILAVAFTLGFFPMAGIAYLRNIAKRVLRGQVGAMQVDYPLSDLDGLNVWYEARLLEEGIEDMSALVDANIVEVMLHTRVPVGRLVDWLDQAHLYLHLPPRSAGRNGTAQDGSPVAVDGDNVRDVLRMTGICNATSLLAAFGHYTPVEDEACARPQELVDHVTSVNGIRGCLDSWITEGIAERASGKLPHAGRIRLDAIVRVLANETALAPVINWRQWGAGRQEQLLVGKGDADGTSIARAHGKFEVYTDKTGEFRWRLKAANGETVASGESYKTRQGAHRGVGAVQRSAENARLEDLTVEFSPGSRSRSTLAHP